MKTWILRMLMALATIEVAQDAMPQSYKDCELFKSFLQSYQNAPLQDNIDFYPEYFNPDGSHRFYVVDTLSADRVEAILMDPGPNCYAVVDTTSLLSSKCGNILDSNSVYLFIRSEYVFVHIPYVGKFNAFCDHYIWEFLYYFDYPEGGYTQLWFEKPDHVKGENYDDYFKKHARKFGKKRYLEVPIINKPLYYMVLLMEGKVYDELMSTLYSTTDILYNPIEFRDTSAYYRVLIPVFRECE